MLSSICMKSSERENSLRLDHLIDKHIANPIKLSNCKKCLLAFFLSPFYLVYMWAQNRGHNRQTYPLLLEVKSNEPEMSSFAFLWTVLKSLSASYITLVRYNNLYSMKAALEVLFIMFRKLHESFRAVMVLDGCWWSKRWHMTKLFTVASDSISS